MADSVILYIRSGREHKFVPRLKQCNLNYKLISRDIKGFLTFTIALLICRNVIILVDFPGIIIKVAAITGKIRCLLFRQPYRTVLRMRGWLPKERGEEIYNKKFKPIINSIDTICCVDEYLCKLAKKKYPKKNIETVFPYINFYNPTSLNLVKREPVILSVSNFSLSQKVNPFIRSVPKIVKLLDAKSDLKWIIVGGGRYLDKIRNNPLIQEYILHGRIELYGKIKQKGVMVLMHKASVLFYATELDFFCNVVAEAFFARLPVILYAPPNLLPHFVDNKNCFRTWDPSRIETKFKMVLETEQIAKITKEAFNWAQEVKNSTDCPVLSKLLIGH